jgi:hypothetical protein
MPLAASEFYDGRKEKGKKKGKEKMKEVSGHI